LVVDKTGPEAVLRGIRLLELRDGGEPHRDSHLQAGRRGTLLPAGHLGNRLLVGRPDNLPAAVDLGTRLQAGRQGSLLLLLGILTF